MFKQQKRHLSIRSWMGFDISTTNTGLVKEVINVIRYANNQSDLQEVFNHMDYEDGTYTIYEDIQFYSKYKHIIIYLMGTLYRDVTLVTKLTTEDIRELSTFISNDPYFIKERGGKDPNNVITEYIKYFMFMDKLQSLEIDDTQTDIYIYDNEM